MSFWRSLARFLSPALHEKLVDYRRSGIIKMASQCFSVFIQFGLFEQSLSDDRFANGVNERDEVRAAVIPQEWRFDGHFYLDILNTGCAQQHRQPPANK